MFGRKDPIELHIHVHIHFESDETEQTAEKIAELTNSLRESNDNLAQAMEESEHED